MKKILFGLFFFLITACNNNNSDEKKAEQAVKLYFYNLNHKTNAYKIIGYKYFHPVFFQVEDDPNYEKYKNNSGKLDSIKKRYVNNVRVYIIYVIYEGKDYYGNIGKHYYQCYINKELSKCTVAIEVNDLP